MTRKLVLLQSPDGEGEKRTPRKKKRVGEVAGGTTAECAVVCCCFPCALMNLLVLAFVKVPACICRKVKERKRLARKKQQKALLDSPSIDGSREEEFDLEIKEQRHRVNNCNAIKEKEGNHNNGHVNNNDGDGDLDNEMWDRFYGTGFWRSPSQKDA